MLFLESGHPNLRIPLHARLCLLCERQEVLRVSPPRLLASSRCVEPFPRVLPDRLQHRVAALAEAQQALLDEGLQRVEVGVADLLGGLQSAAAGEDGEAREEPALGGREQVVRPLDRRPERLLAGIGVAAPAEQVEALREALQDPSWR